MKKERIAAVSLAVLALLLGGCRKSSSETEQRPLVKEGTLTVAYINGEDGFVSREDGELTGTEIYLAEQFAETLGLSLEYREGETQEELLSMLDTGTADMALGCFNESFEGSDSYSLSRNYGKRGYYLVSRAGNYADTLAGLNGKNVAISDKISTESALEIPLINQVSLVSFSDEEEAAEAVENKTVEACICTERQAWKLLDRPGLQVKELYDSPRELYCAVFPAAATDRTAQFNKIAAAYLDDVASGAVSAEGKILKAGLEE